MALICSIKFSFAFRAFPHKNPSAMFSLPVGVTRHYVKYIIAYISEKINNRDVFSLGSELMNGYVLEDNE